MMAGSACHHFSAENAEFWQQRAIYCQEGPFLGVLRALLSPLTTPVGPISDKYSLQCSKYDGMWHLSSIKLRKCQVWAAKGCLRLRRDIFGLFGVVFSPFSARFWLLWGPKLKNTNPNAHNMMAGSVCHHFSAENAMFGQQRAVYG